ncbi:MAG: 4Fe-4S ferredoxin, partial [Acidobacteriota bacterium]|nr:4Fe-4S ferredoxin [Acidobacteriota bacterium]
SLFAGAASGFAGMLLFDMPGRPLAGFGAVLLGAAGVMCSARIYLVRARPAWNSGYTVAEFFATALLLGPLFVRATGAAGAHWVAWAAACGGAAQLAAQMLKFLWLAQSETFELRASSRLIGGRFRGVFLVRLGVLVAAGLVAPLASGRLAVSIAAFALALAGEWLGRWLFFVTVVPKNMAAGFTARPKVAA